MTSRRLMSALLAVALLSGCGAIRKAPSPQPAATPQPVAPAPVAPAPPPAPVTTPPAPVTAPPQPPPPPQALIEPARVLQGDVAVLHLDRPVTGAVKVAVKGLSEQPKVYTVAGGPVAFIGFPADARIGAYPVTVSWTGGSWQGSIDVLRKQFTEDRLTVNEEQTNIYYDPKQDQDWARLFAARSHSAAEPLWRGPFRPPLNGPLRVTTYFGEIRFVNGKETGRHSGMDFGAETGTPIVAPARGMVVLAEKLIVTGWTIAIDHGCNLYTTYYHASRVDVKPGDWVEPGQQVGLVGSTGFSTGPHLHWTASIGNTPVNPWPLTEAAPLGVLPLSQRPHDDIKE